LPCESPVVAARNIAMALRTRQTTREQPDVTPRRGHPLLWLVVLVALLVIGWSVYNRNAAHAATPAKTSPAVATQHASRPVSRLVDAHPVRPARSTRSPRP
jgi:ammonia channel protein AmtB